MNEAEAIEFYEKFRSNLSIRGHRLGRVPHSIAVPLFEQEIRLQTKKCVAQQAAEQMATFDFKTAGNFDEE